MEYSDGLQPGSQFLAERECLEYANKIGSSLRQRSADCLLFGDLSHTDDGLFPLNPKVRLQASEGVEVKS